MTRMPVYFLGVDIGSTKTHALVCDELGRVLGFGESGPGNHEVVGYAGLSNALRTAAGQPTGLPLGHVAVQDYSVFNSTTGFGLRRSQLRDQGLQALAEPAGLPLGHVAFFISLFQVYDERLLTDMLLSAI